MELARVQSPEELELDLKRAELAALEQELVERELALSTLQQQLAAFEAVCPRLRLPSAVAPAAQVVVTCWLRIRSILALPPFTDPAGRLGAPGGFRSRLAAWACEQATR